MKKVKLMLLSLSIFAVVGGALAFTAKVGAKVCVASPDDNSCDKACPGFASIKSTTDAGLFICTAATNGNSQDPCGNVHCNSRVNSVLE